MAVTHVFAGIPVTDRDVSAAWYARLVGRPPDLIPNDAEAAWRLTDSGWIYVIVDPDRAGTALSTVLVDDLDTFLAGATERGIETGRIETIPGEARSVYVSDPDGNRLQIGQPAT